mgnify:CR=1 FL=1
MKNNLTIAILFPKDSEAIFNKNSKRTFGGSTIHLYQFAKELHGYCKTYTVIPDYGIIDFDDQNKFDLVKLYKENDNFVLKFLKFWKFIKQNKVSVVMQLGLTLQSCFLAIFCYFFNIKFIFMFAHDVESIGLYQNSRKRCLLFYWLLRFSKLLITQNEIERENIIEKYPNFSNKIKVLKKGIDFSLIHQGGTKLYDGIAIARCEEWKNIEAYLDIVQRNPGYKFMLVSPPVPGKEAYHEKIREMALSLSNLEFYSFVPYYDVYKYFSFSKTIFVTSDLEGDWPLTVIEAAATGLPVLSLNYNYGNLIDEYHAGFFCNGDLNQMNENFLRLMNDEKLLKFMSKNAMAYADVNHNSSKNVLILLKYLNEL